MAQVGRTVGYARLVCTERAPDAAREAPEMASSASSRVIRAPLHRKSARFSMQPVGPEAVGVKCRAP